MLIDRRPLLRRGLTGDGYIHMLAVLYQRASHHRTNTYSMVKTRSHIYAEASEPLTIVARGICPTGKSIGWGALVFDPVPPLLVDDFTNVSCGARLPAWLHRLIATWGPTDAAVCVAHVRRRARRVAPRVVAIKPDGIIRISHANLAQGAVARRVAGGVATAPASQAKKISGQQRRSILAHLACWAARLHVQRWRCAGPSVAGVWAAEPRANAEVAIP